MAEFNELKKLSLQMLGAAEASMKYATDAKGLAIQINDKLEKLKNKTAKDGMARKYMNDTYQRNIQAARKQNEALKKEMQKTRQDVMALSEQPPVKKIKEGSLSDDDDQFNASIDMIEMAESGSLDKETTEN